MRLSFTSSVFAVSVLGLLSCSSSLTMQRSQVPLETALGKLKTSAYAQVNSPKQDGELYLAKDGATLRKSPDGYKLTLDPANFKNAYSFLELSFAGDAGTGVQKMSILLQGEGFADAYRTPTITSGKDVSLMCDGSAAMLMYKGVAQSATNSMMEPVDLKLVFVLPAELKSACK